MPEHDEPMIDRDPEDDPAEQGREGDRDLPPNVHRGNEDDDASLVGAGDRSER